LIDVIELLVLSNALESSGRLLRPSKSARALKVLDHDKFVRLSKPPDDNFVITEWACS
jgi:hypothetical protein